MNNRKRCLLTAIIFLLLSCLLISSCSKNAETIGEASDYIIIHSRSREQSSGMYCIDKEGTVTEKFKNDKMQDLSFFGFDNEHLIISGGRRNNNMLFSLVDDGAFESINWLNDPNYSGVTAIGLSDDSAIAIMNGNYTETTYLNLLVEQDFEGTVIQQNTLEIYARDVFASNGKALIAGKHLLKDAGESVWKASIVNYNLDEHSITDQYYYDNYNCFWEVTEDEKSVFCLAEDKNELINIVCVINKQTFEIENQIRIDDQLCGMHITSEEICVVGNKAVYKISKDNMSVNKALTFDTTETGFVDWAYVYNGHYYVFFRYEQRIVKDSSYEYGILVDIDLISVEKIDTPICTDKKTTMDDILIFPTNMFK